MKLAKGPQLQAAESGGDCDKLECVSHPNEAFSTQLQIADEHIAPADCSKGAGNHSCYVTSPQW